jgi:hypothetical protein
MAAVIVVNDSCLSGISPELRHLQAQLAPQLPYRQAAALLEELLPETGGLNYATTRNRTQGLHKGSCDKTNKRYRIGNDRGVVNFDVGIRHKTQNAG